MDSEYADTDDTHFCLKCRMTIGGLGNYVLHRKEGCYATNPYRPIHRSNADVFTEPGPISPESIEETNDPCLKADDFFSQLELQSRSKKTEGNGESSKSSAGTTTRIKASVTIATKDEQMADEQRTTSFLAKPRLNRQLPVLGSIHDDVQSANKVLDPNLAICHLAEEDDDDLDELKDAGCPPSKVVGGKWGKPSGIGESPTPWTTPLLDEEREFPWVLSSAPQDQVGTWDSQLPQSQSGKTQAQTSAVSSDSLSGKNPTSMETSDFHVGHGQGEKRTDKTDQPEGNPGDSGREGQTEASTRMKRSRDDPSASEVHLSGWKPQYQVHEPHSPPPITVGGKWKPGHSEVTMRSEEDDTEENQRRYLMAPLPPPPPGHTRGKWAPGMESRVRAAMGLEPAGANEEQDDTDLTADSPARKSGSTVQYWCAPCKRRLSSRSLYERHLLSELHFKRTLPQESSSDLSEQEPRQRTKRPRRQEKRNSSIQGEPTTSGTPSIEHPQPRAPEQVTERNGSQCHVCGARVFENQIGKHLVSHYHWRGMQRTMARALNEVDKEAVKKAADQMVLDNIHAVVRQAPFQCGVCHFYCNSSSIFRDHWTSQMHLQKEAEVEGEFWCWPCDTTHETSADVLAHLNSSEHFEVEASLNRTLPVIVRRRKDHLCGQPGCNRRFRLNLQLRRHQQTAGHMGPPRCGVCGIPKPTHFALQRHVLRAHPVDKAKEGGPVYCARTQRLYPCAALAAAAPPGQNDGASVTKSKPLSRLRKCSLCDALLPNVKELRAHMDQEHPDSKIRCARCNAAFSLPQQVTRHVRTGGCAEELRKQQLLQENKQLQAPIQVNLSQGADEDQIEIIEVPGSLKTTDEAPLLPRAQSPVFVSAGDGLAAPVKPEAPAPPIVGLLPGTSRDAGNLNRGGGGPSFLSNESNLTEAAPGILDVSYTCGSCPYRTDSRADLMYHEVLHKVKDEYAKNPIRCPWDGCDRIFPYAASLRAHIRTHTQEKPFKCPSCAASYTRRFSLANHRRTDHGQDPDREEPPQNPADPSNFTITDPKDIVAKVEQWSDWRTAKVISDADSQLCAVCGKRLRDRATLRKHMETHGEKIFECEHIDCSYTAQTLSALKRHLVSHSEDRPFACDMCVFRTKSRAQLQRHRMSHTGVRPHLCPHCDFSSKLPLHLKRHMRIHTGFKPYKCPHCDYTCNVIENLRKHVLTTKQHSGKQVYICRECDVTDDGGFATNSAKEFHTHLTKMHPAKFTTSSEVADYIKAGITNPEAEAEEGPASDDDNPSTSQDYGDCPCPENTCSIDPLSQETEEKVETMQIVDQADVIGQQVTISGADGQVYKWLVVDAGNLP